jgi:4-hydroxy-3-polyprenylbenzoate decarboxylase
VTGASGAILAARLLAALDRLEGVGLVHLVVSRHARTSLREELDIPSDGPLDLKRLLGFAPARIREHEEHAVDACISSGSYRHAGMAVVPCSVGTAARIASGISDSLLTRAADVCLKERRPLVLAVREAPLSRIHLANLLRAAEAGAVILPPVPAFYARPRSIEEMADQFVARVLDHLGLDHAIGSRWRAPQGAMPAGRT